MNVTIETTGIDGIVRTLATADARTADTLEDVALAVLDDARAFAAAYPPERPNQVYVRTYDLQEAWETALPLVSANTVRLRNLVPYSGAVQDADDQAPIHKGRWDTTAQILADLQPVAQAELDRAVTREARALEAGS